jgi:hypothetical protein
MPKSGNRTSQQDLDDIWLRATNANNFSQLTYLLKLVTALNANDSRPGFLAYRHGKGKAITKDEDIHPLNGSILDSVAAILVQQHEVVAACYTSNKVAVVVAETDPNPSTDTDVLVESPSPGSHTFYPLQLAAVSNPDFGDFKSVDVKPNANLHNLHIRNKGVGFWKIVQDKFEWCCVLM